MAAETPRWRQDIVPPGMPDDETAEMFAAAERVYPPTEGYVERVMNAQRRIFCEGWVHAWRRQHQYLDHSPGDSRNTE
jgi:hypothetical protein